MDSAEPSEANGEKAKARELVQSLSITDGTLESPIDLNITFMKVIELDCLQWRNIEVQPKKLKITNTGRTVILSATWQQERAHLSGGPLTGDYVFSQIHFHWGENEMNGSEHTVDGASMPMELHAVYFKTEYKTVETAVRRDDGVTILVYLFKLQDEPNRFIEEIARNMHAIRRVRSSVRLTPSPLTNITRPFKRDYFLYWGSVVMTHTDHKILWMISREPIGISVEQVAEFRTLTDERNAPISSNLRPLRERNGRSVFHVCPSGSTYASLLPIPWDYSSANSDEIAVTATDASPENN